MKTIVLDRQNVESLEKKGEENGEKENSEGDADKEVLLIQDTGFNVKIAAPNLDVFELPVSKFIKNSFIGFLPLNFCPSVLYSKLY